MNARSITVIKLSKDINHGPYMNARYLISLCSNNSDVIPTHPIHPNSTASQSIFIYHKFIAIPPVRSRLARPAHRDQISHGTLLEAARRSNHGCPQRRFFKGGYRRSLYHRPLFGQNGVTDRPCSPFFILVDTDFDPEADLWVDLRGAENGNRAVV